MRYYVLYNELAGRVKGKPEIKLNSNDEKIYVSMLGIKNMQEYLNSIPSEDGIIICGGDGTLNHFINDINGKVNRVIYYYPSGSGNDFAYDVGNKGIDPFPINQYLEDLPIVTYNNKSKLFLDNVSFGIDGYCCEVGDKQKAANPDKPVNYTSIAIKGLLGGYKPRNAVVTVDGQTYTFKKVWLAATMNGRYCGGGMNMAPNQDRLNKDHSVSLVVMYGSSKLKSLMVFPGIFKGKLVNHKELCVVYTGHNIDVEFDRPCAMQIDGETELNITGYHVETK